MPRTGKNIYERKDGRFEGRYIVSHDENGKAKYACVYGKSRHEVEAKLLEARAMLKAQEVDGVLTFRKAYECWLEDRKKTISEASADRYEYLIEKKILPEFGNRDVTTVTQTQINTYIASLGDSKDPEKETIRGTTLESLLSLTKSILAFARDMDQGVPDLHDMVKIEKTSYPVLTGDEIRRLVACAKYNKSPEMLGVMLSLYTGLGTGELCALMWDDFDTERREICVRHTLYRVRNKDGGENRTRLTVTDVRRSHVRTLQYPEQLQAYVMKYYRIGCVFLTGEKEKYLEQRTFCNRLERTLKLYGMQDMTLVRVKKTFDAGLADVRYLTDPFYENAEGKKERNQMRLDERWLLKEMENDLLSLRSILGISTSDMGNMMGVSEEDYRAMEAGEASMGWDVFLSLLFMFKYNSRTEPLVEALGLFPEALRERMAIETPIQENDGGS